MSITNFRVKMLLDEVRDFNWQLEEMFSHGISAEISSVDSSFFYKILTKVQPDLAISLTSKQDYFTELAYINQHLHKKAKVINSLLEPVLGINYCAAPDGTNMTITFTNDQIQKLRAANMPLPALAYACLDSPIVGRNQVFEMLTGIEQSLQTGEAELAEIRSSVEGVFEGADGCIQRKRSSSLKGLEINMPSLDVLFTTFTEITSGKHKEYRSMDYENLRNEALEMFASVGIHPLIQVYNEGARIVFSPQDAATILSYDFMLPEKLSRPLTSQAAKWIFEQRGINLQRIVEEQQPKRGLNLKN